MDEWKCNQCGARYTVTLLDFIPKRCEDEECNEGTLILIQDSEWPQMQLQGSSNPPLPPIALSPETPLTDPKTPDSNDPYTDPIPNWVLPFGLSVGASLPLSDSRYVIIDDLLDAISTPEGDSEVVETYGHHFVPAQPDPQLTSEQSRTLDRTADNFCMICLPEWVSGIPHIPNDPLVFAHAPNCVAHLLCDSCKAAILEQQGKFTQHKSSYADPDTKRRIPDSANSISDAELEFILNSEDLYDNAMATSVSIQT